MQRSLLFVPATRPERFEKAISSGADAVVIDLEDAVQEDHKARARDILADWLSIAHPVIIRINGADTPWFHDDLAICKLPGVVGVMLPKAEKLEEVSAVAQIGRDRFVLPLIETAFGLNNIQAIATSPGVRRLAFGSIDFQLDVGMSVDSDGPELLAFRGQIVLASRLAEIESPIDGVNTAIDSPESLRSSAMNSRRLGFGGKLCIHPKQVALVNECYRPSPEEVAWAKRVLAAVDLAAGAAISVDGKMVDRPVALRAARIVYEASDC